MSAGILVPKQSGNAGESNPNADIENSLRQLAESVKPVDENKVAGLSLEEETRSILRTRASGDEKQYATERRGGQGKILTAAMGWLAKKDLILTEGGEVYGRGANNSASRTPFARDNAEGNSQALETSISQSGAEGKQIPMSGNRR